MDEWKPGDPADWGDHVGVPDIPYMGYLNDDDDDEETPEWENKETSLAEKAWKAHIDGRNADALKLIDEALSHNTQNLANWNIKAIILQEMSRYEESKECYDKSLKLAKTETVVVNKARMLKDWAMDLYLEEGENEKALALISEAINELLSKKTDEDIKAYRGIKKAIQREIERKKS